MVGPGNGNFPLLYLVKISLHRWVGGSRRLKTPLRSIKMAPYSKEKDEIPNIIKQPYLGIYVAT